jgi:tetratricopeptide (TPR) repeat protein
MLAPLAMVVMAVICAGGPLLVRAAAPAGPTVSAAANKAMTAVKKAADAKQFDDVVLRANEVLAIPARSAVDAFVAYQFLAVAYAQKNDVPKLLEALQGQVDSGVPQGAERTKIISDMMRIAYEAKNHAKAEEYGSQLIKAGAADDDMYRLVAFSMYQQGKHADAARLMGEHVADLVNLGKVPGEQALQVLVTAQDKSGDQPGVADTLEKLITHYPKVEYWRLALQSAGRGLKLGDRQNLQLYRLRMATETLSRCAELRDMANMLTRVGLFGEAQSVLESGLASKLCAETADQDALQQILTAASKAASRAREELKDLEAEARDSGTGELDAVLGSLQFGFGDFARSAEALARGIGKGGIKNLVDAQFVLGIAQFRKGDKAAAAKTFHEIRTDDPFNARLARLWALQVR